MELFIIAFLPCIVGLLVYFNSTISDKNKFLITTIVSIIELFLIIKSYTLPTQNYAIYNDVFKISFGIDDLSFLFLCLTGFIFAMVMIISSNQSLSALLLITESIVILFFLAKDLASFYVFFEMSLIPLFFIIGIWGGKNRALAGYKFLIYTLIGSLLLLISFIVIINKFGILGFDVLKHNNQSWLWWLIFIGLAIKIPLFPFHTWLPNAHTEAPTEGSMILAGIMLKMGGYGMIRLLLIPMFDLSMRFSEYVIVLSLITMLYASFLCLYQNNIKKLIAYSSIAHMSYVVMGIFSCTSEGLNGAVFQMISHGIISPGLFLIVGIIYHNYHTRNMKTLSGLAHQMPALAVFSFLLLLGAIGFPSTSGFIAELIIILAVFKYNIIYGFVVTTGIVLSALYMLKLYNTVFFYEIQSRFKIHKLHVNQIIVLSLLTIIVFILGLYPNIMQNWRFI